MTEPPAGRGDGIAIRPAVAADAEAVADVYLVAFTSTYDFPLAHTDTQVRAWIRDDVVPRLETWVADDGGRVIAMMVLDEKRIDQLYVEPAWQGRGIGGRLVALAKAQRPGGLGLYTFQVNHQARRFYEHHGFVIAALGDGSANEEGQPDVRYEWRP